MHVRKTFQLILSWRALKCRLHRMSMTSWLSKCVLHGLALVLTGRFSRRCYLHVALILLNLPQLQLNSPGILLRRAYHGYLHLHCGSCSQHGSVMYHTAALRSITPDLAIKQGPAGVGGYEDSKE